MAGFVASPAGIEEQAGRMKSFAGQISSIRCRELETVVKSLAANEALSEGNFDGQVHYLSTKVEQVCGYLQETASLYMQIAELMRIYEQRVLAGVKGRYSLENVPEEPTVRHHYSQYYEVGANAKYFGLTWTVHSPLSPIGEYLGARLAAWTHDMDFNPDEWDSPFIGFKELFQGEAGPRGGRGKFGGSLADNKIELRIGTRESNFHAGFGWHSLNASAEIEASAEEGNAGYQVSGGYSLADIDLIVGVTTDNTRHDVVGTASFYGKGGSAGSHADGGSSTIGGNYPIEKSLEKIPLLNRLPKTKEGKHGSVGFGLHYNTQDQAELDKITMR